MTKHKKPKPEEIVEPPRIGVTIEQLSSLTCRWPLWDDGSPFRNYCGKATVHGWSYCEKHKRLAMRIPPKGV